MPSLQNENYEKIYKNVRKILQTRKNGFYFIRNVAKRMSYKK